MKTKSKCLIPIAILMSILPISTSNSSMVIFDNNTKKWEPIMEQAKDYKSSITERYINAEIIVNESIKTVWKYWTTSDGIKSFFGPDCKIDIKVGGAYEIYFHPQGGQGQKGAEGTIILAIQPEKMLSFSWNNPPYMQNVHWQYTSVVVRFKALEKNQTKVTLFHSGWGEGEDWDAAFDFFDQGWRNQVLPFLKHSIEVGPIDWENPPKI